MSTAVAAKARYTPEELLEMPDGKNYELVAGQLVERNMGAESSWVGGELFVRLWQHCEKHKLGRLFPADNGYQCFPYDPGLVRKPDVSFIRHGRLPGDELPKGWVKIPPDLAVEVVSPGDLAYKLDEKLSDYQEVGVPLVWVIYPGSRTVIVYRGDGSASRLSEKDELSGEEVVPGFRCPVRELFPPLRQPVYEGGTQTPAPSPGEAGAS
jgi:Uma2 family endonuclease